MSQNENQADQRLKLLKFEITEAEATLKRLSKEISEAELAGADAIRSIGLEVNQLENEKARLMKQLLSLQQKIDEHRLEHAHI